MASTSSEAYRSTVHPDRQRVQLGSDTLRDTLRELTAERQELTGRILGGRQNPA
ncbi:MAG TPA: hypothetical protein VGN81_07445 [Pseudonocardiaceae bacterium]